MPIRIPDSLPATSVLEGENIFVMTEHRALHQDIRPLNLLILNLMPTKIVTETQLLRKLSNTPLQINVHLLKTISHTAQNTDSQHLDSFYTTFEQVRENRYDGMIITGAPVENLDFEDVDYWEELCQIMEWTKTHVHSTLHVCWGAQAGLFYHYGIPKYSLDKKLFGVFPHTAVKKQSPLFRGFDDVFYIPHSRHTENHLEDILDCPELELLAVSDEAGLFGVKSATVVFSSWAIRSTIQTLWPKNIFGTWAGAWTLMFLLTIFPTTIPANPPWSPGVPLVSCYTPTGLIITSIRPPLTI